jgi:hypothetical protein
MRVTINTEYDQILALADTLVRNLTTEVITFQNAWIDEGERRALESSLAGLGASSVTFKGADVQILRNNTGELGN